MAPTFVVEDGTGVAGANSYSTDLAALQYHEDIGTPTADWASVPLDEREQALRDATRYLDAKYGKRWKGYRSDGTNPLDWPRQSVIDTDGFNVVSNTIPQALLDATAEAALRSRDAAQNPDGLTPDITGAGIILLKREKFDVFEEETEYAGGVDPYVTFTVIDRLLHDLIISGSSQLAGRA
jgi:hypothetical protein